MTVKTEARGQTYRFRISSAEKKVPVSRRIERGEPKQNIFREDSLSCIYRKGTSPKMISVEITVSNNSCIDTEKMSEHTRIATQEWTINIRWYMVWDYIHRVNVMATTRWKNNMNSLWRRLCLFGMFEGILSSSLCMRVTDEMPWPIFTSKVTCIFMCCCNWCHCFSAETKCNFLPLLSNYGYCTFSWP